MVLDEVSSEMLRRKLDDARFLAMFLAMWVANETARRLRSYGSRRLGGGGGDLRGVRGFTLCVKLRLYECR